MSLFVSLNPKPELDTLPPDVWRWRISRKPSAIRARCHVMSLPPTSVNVDAAATPSSLVSCTPLSRCNTRSALCHVPSRMRDARSRLHILRANIRYIHTCYTEPTSGCAWRRCSDLSTISPSQDPNFFDPTRKINRKPASIQGSRLVGQPSDDGHA